MHGGLAGHIGSRPRAGYLVSLRDVVCRQSRLDTLDGDLIVEAVTENEKLKTQIIAELATVARPDAMFASNTSTISITRLAKA